MNVIIFCNDGFIDIHIKITGFRPCSLHMGHFCPFFHFNLPNRLSLYRDTHSKVFISDPGQHFLSFQLAAPPIFPTTTTPGAAETYAETMAPTIKNSSPPTSSSSNDEVLEKKKEERVFCGDNR